MRCVRRRSPSQFRVQACQGYGLIGMGFRVHVRLRTQDLNARAPPPSNPARFMRKHGVVLQPLPLYPPMHSKPHIPNSNKQIIINVERFKFVVVKQGL